MVLFFPFPPPPPSLFREVHMSTEIKKIQLNYTVFKDSPWAHMNQVINV